MKHRLIVVALAIASIVAACSPAIIPLDTKPTSEGTARDLASSVANSAGCGSFEDLASQPDQMRWAFTCQRGEVTYEILAFGSDSAKSAGAELLADGSVYIARNSYAVVVTPSGPSKSAALQTKPSASLLDPFR